MTSITAQYHRMNDFLPESGKCICVKKETHNYALGVEGKSLAKKARIALC